MPRRDYARVCGEVAARISPESDLEERMRAVADCLWEAFSSAGVSWCGFYLPDGERRQLVLGPRRDKPACSPIGLGGACGRCFTEGAPLVVRDVADLGENYIACDPRDRSEVVIPLLAPDGSCRGVLDLDSHELAAFDAADAEGLGEVLIAAGLTVSSGAL
ncbi:MAG: GAF domain-containing protein [Planctomycetota bacterium]